MRRISSFNQQGMLAGPRLVFSGHPNGTFAAHRAFMLAYAAANAQPGIDVGLLQPYLNRYRFLGCRWLFKWVIGVNRQTAVCIGDDLPSLTFRTPRYITKIIPGGILIGN